MRDLLLVAEHGYRARDDGHQASERKCRGHRSFYCGSGSLKACAKLPPASGPANFAPPAMDRLAEPGRLPGYLPAPLSFLPPLPVRLKDCYSYRFHKRKWVRPR